MEYAGEEDPIDAYWVLGDFGASKPLGRNKNSGMTLADIRTEPYGPTRTPKEKQHEETWDVFGWGAVAVSLVSAVFTDSKRLNSSLHGEFKTKVPKAIFEVVQKCLSEEPELRWKNVKELKKALRRAEKKVPVKKGGAAAGKENAQTFVAN